ncbi:MAG TPA: transglycosylase SLT domain-containing protein [Acetobacteraceae bacterium]|nr:transglycosylase SLT domain-containing protein [Acetobacteraceae bacterium]
MMAPLGITAASCRQAIGAAERANAIPPGLLGAIGRVESGRRDPGSGAVEPWPWTADVDGAGSFYESKAAAIAAVRQAQGQGIRSIDVGCMQVNLQQHPDAFPSLEAAFDPVTNVAYAVRFLQSLHQQTGDWAKAAAMYHSATPSIGAEYERKVLAAWPEERSLAAAWRSSPAPTPLARAWVASLGGSRFGLAGGLHGFSGRPVGAGALFTPVAASMGGSPGGSPPAGRGLASYRAMPVMPAFLPRGPLIARR